MFEHLSIGEVLAAIVITMMMLVTCLKLIHAYYREHLRQKLIRRRQEIQRRRG